MVSVGKSHKGLRRDKNEDSFFCLNQPFYKLPNLFIVADGLGGHKSGDVASINSINYFKKFISQIDFHVDTDNILDVLVDAFHYTNDCVHNLSKSDEQYFGMGTTFTAITILKNKIYGVHVGDTRVYTYNDNVLKQITDDHTYVMELLRQNKISEEETRSHIQRNVLLRALGTEATLSVTTILEAVTPNTLILLCSDGLNNMVSDAKIKELVENDKNIVNIADKLIVEANRNGGIDNITVILVRGDE